MMAESGRASGSLLCAGRVRECRTKIEKSPAIGGKGRGIEK